MKIQKKKIFFGGVEGWVGGGEGLVRGVGGDMNREVKLL